MTFSPFSAKNAQVRANGTVFTSKKWTVEFDGGNNDCSNFEAAGFDDAIGGLKSATITITYDYDRNSDMFNTGALNFQPGNQITSLILYLFLTTNVNACWTFPLALVLPMTNDADVKANMAGVSKFKNKGTFTPPSGVF